MTGALPTDGSCFTVSSSSRAVWMVQLRVSFQRATAMVSRRASLIGASGLKLLDQGVHQFVEDRGGFGLQHDAARELAVAEGVLRRGLLAFFGDGSGGAFCVGAVGLDLIFGCHRFWVGGRVRSEGMIYPRVARVGDGGS